MKFNPVPARPERICGARPLQQLRSPYFRGGDEFRIDGVISGWELDRNVGLVKGGDRVLFCGLRYGLLLRTSHEVKTKCVLILISYERRLRNRDLGCGRRADVGEKNILP